MPSREEVHYFGAGPAPLPTAVLEDAAKALLNYNDSGVGIAEISHRSSDAAKVIADAKASLSDLLDIPDDYEILFLQGGGSGQFSAVVYHMVSVWIEKQRLLAEKIWHGSAMEKESEEVKLKEFKAIVHRSLRLDYLVSGSWSLKASQEAARLVGPDYVKVAFDARDQNDGKFGKIPAESKWKLRRPYVESVGHQPMQSAFTYYCDNETVDGVEFPAFPHVLEALSDDDDRLVVADMSSNFLSRKVDVSKYAIIFGGAQKNIGVAGVTIVIVRKSLLPPHAQMASPTLLRQLGLPIGPIVFDLPTVAKNNSLYNTLPIFDVWVAGQVMRRLTEAYGAKRIAGQEDVSDAKAKLLYGILDKYPEVYQVVPDRSVRSRMNVCFRVKHGDAAAEKALLGGAEKLNLLGIKGHRSVGGMRISNYNAVSMEGVQKMVEYLEGFAQS